MKNQTNSLSPKLGAPGAGLPFFQGLVARYILVPRAFRKTTWEQSRERFLLETERIMKSVDRLERSRLAKPVLVPRMRGIEDSSRFWSPAMCLEHLTITAPKMTRIVIDLSQGIVPAMKISTAAVKPKGVNADSDLCHQFKSLMLDCDRRLEREVANKDAEAKLAHPWFGPFSARQWQWILGVHQVIHRKQIEKIIELG